MCNYKYSVQLQTPILQLEFISTDNFRLWLAKELTSATDATVSKATTNQERY